MKRLLKFLLFTGLIVAASYPFAKLMIWEAKQREAQIEESNTPYEMGKNEKLIMIALKQGI